MLNPFKSLTKSITQSDEGVDLNLYVIYDSKSKSYRSPTAAKNDQVMIRELMSMLADPRQSHNALLVSAEDFSLYRIGSFDYKSGLLSTYNLQHILNLHDVRTSIFALRDQLYKVEPAPQKPAQDPSNN